MTTAEWQAASWRQRAPRRRYFGLSLTTTALAAVGLVLVVLFEAGVVLPAPVSIVGLAALCTWGLLGGPWRDAAAGPGLLSRFGVLVYCLPFAVTVGWLFDSNYTWWDTPATVRLMRDPRVQSVMVMTGLIGLVGLLLGCSQERARADRRPPTQRSHAPQQRGRLRMLTFLGLSAASLVLSWLSAPSKDIFTAAYAARGTGSLGKSFNFNAGYLGSYILLVLLWVDLEQERSRRERRLKRFVVGATVAVIVFYFQLARGDREAAGLVAGLTVLYVTQPMAQPTLTFWKNALRRLRRAVRRRLIVIVVPVALLLGLFLAVGAVRTILYEGRADEIDAFEAVERGFRRSTWTAVLLNNLAAAGEYCSGDIEYFNGQTYVDYLLSLPPGVVARALDYERPMELHRNPGTWYQGLNAGGMHVVIVPFKNFGIVGALVVMAAIGWLLSVLDRWGAAPDVWSRLAFGSAVTTLLFWFWYGDMNAIRGAMFVLIIGVVYHLLAVRVRPRRQPGAPAQPPPSEVGPA